MGIVFGDGAVAVVKKKVQSYSGVVGKTLHIMLPSGWDSLILRIVSIAIRVRKIYFKEAFLASMTLYLYLLGFFDIEEL